MPSSSTNFFAVIDLPTGSIISFDGQTVAVKRDDFVGFSAIPSDGRFHLVTIRAGSDIASNQGNQSATTVGFYLSSRENLSIIRRFDPTTEEVSSNPVDKVTSGNLVRGLEAQQIGPERIISYDRFLSNQQRESWKQLTSYITDRLLKRRGLESGCKLVAGSFDDEEDDVPSEVPGIVDGISVAFPMIPVINLQAGVRHSSHVGTKKFMANLSSSERTALFTDANPTTRALENVLRQYYDDNWQDLLGDLQLSYILFSFLHCYSSLCHWRDLIAMLSVIDLEGAAANSPLFSGLLIVLSEQLKILDQGFFDDSDLTQDSFLVPSLRRLSSTLSRVVDRAVTPALTQFQKLVLDRFPSQFQDDTGVYSRNSIMELENGEEEEGDEDGPVIVPTDEVEASVARSHTQLRIPCRSSDDISVEIRQRFPLLLAAMAPSEDILMTCARALDDANDVTLVREAAAYLEEVEAHR